MAKLFNHRDYITGRRLVKGFNVHHLKTDQDSENYCDISHDEEFIPLNSYCHKMLHYLFIYYQKDPTVMDRIKEILDKMCQLAPNYSVEPIDDIEETLDGSDEDGWNFSAYTNETNSLEATVTQLIKENLNPYSILLFDEIEKAHPDVFNILLQVLDDGRLTDAQGNVVNFENTIIIMTSNAGSNLNTNSIGFGNSQANKNKMIDALKDLFRPEFLNRVDEIITFNPLTNEQLLQIIDLMLKEVVSKIESKKMTVTISEEAKEIILNKSNEIYYSTVSNWEVELKHQKDNNFKLTGEQLAFLCDQNNLLVHTADHLAYI